MGGRFNKGAEQADKLLALFQNETKQFQTLSRSV